MKVRVVAHDVQQLARVLHQLRPGHAAVVVDDDAAARGQGVVVHLDGGYGGSLSGQGIVMIRSNLTILTFYTFCSINALIVTKL